MAAAASRKVLVVANEAVAGAELRGELERHVGGGGVRVHVVSPALAASALKHHMGDVDEARGPAKERLEATLGELRDAGIEASGEVGDSDPITAISDELQKFDADEIVIVAHRDSDAVYAEKDALERADRDFGLPITELVVTAGDEPAVVDTEHAEGPPTRDSEGTRVSANLPPLTRQDMAGIAVGLIGTIVLAILAADCTEDFDTSTFDGCAVRILIAIGAALINLAHIVGIFLFESVRYKGTWERFFARLALIGTPLAVLVSLLVA